MTDTFPYLGFGLGLRPDHYETILTDKPAVDWFEIISENFMVDGGKPLYYLDKVRADYPMVMHGVSLSLAGPTPLDYDYLARLKALIDRVEPAWVSDHLAWTRGNAHNFHDLLPIPYTDELLEHLIGRINTVQDYLGRPLVLENPSSYATFRHSHLRESEFLNLLCQRTGCFLLIDINNIFVSCENHGWDAVDYVRDIHPQYVVQHHLAGHTYHYDGQLIIDTHDQPVRGEVWDLYREAVRHFGRVSTMIERDDNIPPLADLLAELDVARNIQRQGLGQ